MNSLRFSCSFRDSYFVVASVKIVSDAMPCATSLFIFAVKESLFVVKIQIIGFYQRQNKFIFIF